MIATIAVCTDGSPTAGKAMEAALELAERFDATLLVLSAYTPPPRGSNLPRLSGATPDGDWAASEAEHVERILAEAEEAATGRGVRCRTAMAAGDPGDVLVELADQHVEHLGDHLRAAHTEWALRPHRPLQTLATMTAAAGRVAAWAGSVPGSRLRRPEESP